MDNHQNLAGLDEKGASFPIANAAAACEKAEAMVEIDGSVGSGTRKGLLGIQRSGAEIIECDGGYSSRHQTDLTGSKGPILDREYLVPVKKHFDIFLADNGVPADPHQMPILWFYGNLRMRQTYTFSFLHTNHIEMLSRYVHHCGIKILPITNVKHQSRRSTRFLRRFPQPYADNHVEILVL